jgi:peptidoglycan hydrolase-like protein with peptidoglycan-binding domain
MPRGIGKRGLAVGGLGIAAVAVVVVAIGGGDDGGAKAQEPGVPTRPLERRDLASTDSVDGTLGYAGDAAVINRLSGTITWLPAEGDVITRGHRLFEVDGQPVILMYGSVPAYRDLSTGDSGPDVEELEANLSALGFDPGTVDQEFTSLTAAAVADWQDSLDLDSTGSVELGRVAFMAGPRRVTSLSVSLGSSGSSGGGSDGSNPSAAASEESPTSPTATLASYVVDKPVPGGRKKPKNSSKGKRPKTSGSSNGSQQPTAGSGSDSSGTDGSSADTSDGASAAPSVEVMTTSSTRRVVTVDLDPSDGELVKRGTTARVELPDGKDVKGRVSSIGTVAQDDSSDSGTGDSSPTIAVTISLPQGSHVTGLDQAPVTVDLTDQVRHDVFVVPVESLLGTAGGGYAIEVRDSAGRRQIPVEPGLFADGYVEVKGQGLHEGMEVEVPGE